jgi:hypothetical protein
MKKRKQPKQANVEKLIVYLNKTKNEPNKLGTSSSK